MAEKLTNYQTAHSTLSVLTEDELESTGNALQAAQVYAIMAIADELKAIRIELRDIHAALESINRKT